MFLAANATRLDSEIAEAVGLSVLKIRVHLAELSEKGEVISCNTMRFVKGKKFEGVSFRLAGFTPKAAPGRKSKVQLKLS
jgi:predicted transcriptional regulator